MFKLFKDIEANFKKVQKFALLTIVGALLLSGWVIYISFVFARAAEKRIYVLAGGGAFAADAADERDVLPIDARNQVRDFHELLFNLDPDERQIRGNLGKALSMADESAKKFYDDLREAGFITGMISATITERIRIDSIQLVPAEDPWLFRFRCLARLTLTRSSSVTTRSLLTEGFLRKVHRSDQNPHGFLIDRFEVLENKTLDIKKR